VPYAILDGENGILVEEKNPREIARGIIALAGDVGLRARYGERGRARVRELLNWENVAREFVAVYKSAVGER
jgi:phosphatidylinositol alpha-1,6-mannosyltransferase